MYKKIYIEITNTCNLSCNFCAKNNRKKEFMTIENFTIILNKIKDHTKYIYLHVMGEPLLHPKINEFIKIAKNNNFQVNITTNGFLINNLDNIPIRQINISLHSLKEQDKVSYDEYFLNLFFKCQQLSKIGTFINYRIWRNNCHDIIKILEKQYSVIINKDDKTKTLADNIFYSYEDEFDWPEKRLGEGNKNKVGRCLALKNHIAILVDGTIIPCCLDNNAHIPLGNIFKDDLNDIINSPTYTNMLKGFNDNKKINPLCQNCHFYHKLK